MRKQKEVTCQPERENRAEIMMLEISSVFRAVVAYTEVVRNDWVKLWRHLDEERGFYFVSNGEARFFFLYFPTSLW